MEENNQPTSYEQTQSQASVNPEPAITPTPPVTKQTPPEAPKHKSLTLQIILFLILTLGVGAYFAYTNGYLEKFIPTSPTQTNAPIVESTPTPTIDPTADWETYINENAKYSYKYPPNWNAATVKSGKVLTAGSLFGPNATENSGLGGVEMKPDTRTVDQYIDGLIQNGVIGSILQEKLTINGIDGIKVKHSGGGAPLNGYSLYFKKDIYIYTIYINSWDNSDVVNFDQILSTFKFVEGDTISTENKNIEDAITAATYSSLNANWQKPETKISVKINKIEGDFAEGTVNYSLNDDSAGHVWIAKQKNRVWKQIWSGQEVPKCADISQYSVPTSISSCQ